MARLPVVSGGDAVRAFERAGWRFAQVLEWVDHKLFGHRFYRVCNLIVAIWPEKYSTVHNPWGGPIDY